MQPAEGPGPYYPFPRALLPPRTLRVPRDYLFCSLFTFSYVNCCCLGLVALLFSIKSRDCKVIGDPERAADHGKTARCLNIVALTLAIVFFVICVIVFATSTAFFYKKFQDIVTEVQDTNANEPFRRN